MKASNTFSNNELKPVATVFRYYDSRWISFCNLISNCVFYYKSISSSFFPYSTINPTHSFSGKGFISESYEFQSRLFFDSYSGIHTHQFVDRKSVVEGKS